MSARCNHCYRVAVYFIRYAKGVLTGYIASHGYRLTDGKRPLAMNTGLRRLCLAQQGEVPPAFCHAGERNPGRAAKNILRLIMKASSPPLESWLCRKVSSIYCGIRERSGGAVISISVPTKSGNLPLERTYRVPIRWVFGDDTV